MTKQLNTTRPAMQHLAKHMQAWVLAKRLQPKRLQSGDTSILQEAAVASNQVCMSVSCKCGQQSSFQVSLYACSQVCTAANLAESHQLAKLLIAKWAWGHMSTPTLQALALAAREDEAKGRLLRFLAKLGGSGQRPGNMHRDIVACLRRRAQSTLQRAKLSVLYACSQVCTAANLAEQPSLLPL